MNCMLFCAKIVAQVLCKFSSKGERETEAVVTTVNISSICSSLKPTSTHLRPPMQWIGVLLLTFYTFTISCNSSSSSSEVSFVNTSSIVRVAMGQEAVMECATENLANNHLVRDRVGGIVESRFADL